MSQLLFQYKEAILPVNKLPSKIRWSHDCLITIGISIHEKMVLIMKTEHRGCLDIKMLSKFHFKDKMITRQSYLYNRKPMPSLYRNSLYPPTTSLCESWVMSMWVMSLYIRWSAPLYDDLHHIHPCRTSSRAWMTTLQSTLRNGTLSLNLHNAHDHQTKSHKLTQQAAIIMIIHYCSWRKSKHCWKKGNLFRSDLINFRK